MSKLHVKERISLVKMINASSTGFAERITLQAIKKEVDFSEKEVKDLEMRDVNLGNQMTTTWNPQKAEKMGGKDFYLSKERDRVLRKIIIQLCQRTNSLIDGLTENLFNNLKWGKEDLKILSSVVNKMDETEQITEANFEMCSQIKDKTGDKQDKESDEVEKTSEDKPRPKKAKK